MCTAITHPAQREVKMIEGLFWNGKRRGFWIWCFTIRGLENLISIKLAPSIGKLSVPLKSLERGINLLMIVVETLFFLWFCGFFIGRVLIQPICFRPCVQWIQLITDTNADDLREVPFKKVAVVTREEGE